MISKPKNPPKKQKTSFCPFNISTTDYFEHTSCFYIQETHWCYLLNCIYAQVFGLSRICDIHSFYILKEKKTTFLLTTSSHQSFFYLTKNEWGTSLIRMRFCWEPNVAGVGILSKCLSKCLKRCTAGLDWEFSFVQYVPKYVWNVKVVGVCIITLRKTHPFVIVSSLNFRSLPSARFLCV